MFQNRRLWLCLVGALMVQPGSLCAQDNAIKGAPIKVDEIKVDEGRIAMWDGKRALAGIVDLVGFTPRAMETPGHQQTIGYIIAELKKTKFDAVQTQHWTAKEAGRSMAMTNIIARFNPSNPKRVIVATHYDSIIKAYRDAKHPDAPMPGANNSASGVALLLETARAISAAPDAPPVGIDMIFFDGEEGPISMGAGDPNFHPVGSPYFVAHLSDFYPDKKPERMIDFDMVCDRDLHLQAEQSGLSSAPAEVIKFWQVGRKIAPGAFATTVAPYGIDDDHSAFGTAGIPSFVVIDFEYEPFYNTTQDTPDKCSTQSLEAVGRTLLTYLYQP
jgi:glutaminyl-peptide cyclotransferase